MLNVIGWKAWEKKVSMIEAKLLSCFPIKNVSWATFMRGLEAGDKFVFLL